MTEKRAEKSPSVLQKCPTGIQGLDEITYGGLPCGRNTLVCGVAGSGKTLMGIEFLVRGATEFGESGVFMAFEETGEELTQNVASLGFDLKKLIDEKKLAIDFVRIERSEIEETGEYDLEGLFIRINQAIDSVKAKRVVLDTIESLFAGLSNQGILRAELRRLFAWLKNKGVTTVITGETGTIPGTMTRYGLEEYISDCVILLDNRVHDQIATRRLRIAKYRGSMHGSNEYPFLIEDTGLSILPITSIGLTYKVTMERVSSGIPRLDAMLDGKGFYKGSTILISGPAGTGKTSLAASFANAVCKSGERCLYFAFEESPEQIMRNMRSVGIDLEPWVKKGLLLIRSTRPTFYGLEMHLSLMEKLINKFKPSAVIIDPITNLITVSTEVDVQLMLTRLIDYLKNMGITTLMTNLSYVGVPIEKSETGVSSLMDTMILLRDIEIGGERNKGIYIIKSRGMEHSNQIREFTFGKDGIQLVDVYAGPGGVLTGAARVTQEALDKAEALLKKENTESMQRAVDRKRKVMEAKVEQLKAEFEQDLEEANKLMNEAKLRAEVLAQNRVDMGHRRGTNGETGKMKARKRRGK
ncbi:MAG: circadian clock protein KaiC [Candidatus Bathyarchaeia archaeon]